MANIQKALEVLGLPEHFAPYDGQVQTRIMRNCTVYENSETVNGKRTVYYTAEFTQTAPEPFGMYPLNYIAGNLFHSGFQDEGPIDGGGWLLYSPSKFVTHQAPSSLAGQSVYYCENKIELYEDRIELLWEPFETVVNGLADPMTDPIMRVQYKARLISRDASGNPVIKWTSRYAITPKKRLRKSEFLAMAGLTMDEVIYKMRWTFNLVKVDPKTHITNIAMDIEQPEPNKAKAVFYINGENAQTFNYKTLINSFGKTYGGYLFQYRLYNGPGSQIDNMYGSTLDIPLNPLTDSTIKLEAGTVNAYDSKTKTLTFNPDLTAVAKLLAYMEFLPAQGKNENVGKMLNLENGEESFY